MSPRKKVNGYVKVSELAKTKPHHRDVFLMTRNSWKTRVFANLHLLVLYTIYSVATRLRTGAQWSFLIVTV